MSLIEAIIAFSARVWAAVCRWQQARALVTRAPQDGLLMETFSVQCCHSIWASVLSLIARQIGHACNGLMAAVLVLLLMPCRRSALLKPTSNYLLRFVLLVQLLESAELFFLETQHNKDLDYPSRRQVSPPLLPSASTFPQRATHFYDLRGQLGAIQRLRDTDYRASYYFTR